MSVQDCNECISTFLPSSCSQKPVHYFGLSNLPAIVGSFITTPRTSATSMLNVMLRFANSSAAPAFLDKIAADMKKIIHELIDKDLMVCDATVTFSVADKTKAKAPSSKGGKTYNLYQASCTGKIKDKDIKSIRVPRLCCPAPPPRPARGLLQSDVPSIAQCPSATPELPLLGQCPFTTGMVVYVSESSPAARAFSSPSSYGVVPLLVT